MCFSTGWKNLAIYEKFDCKIRYAIKKIKKKEVMDMKRNFLGLLWIIEALIDKGVLHRNPENRNHILVWIEFEDDSKSGWYSQNLHEAANELWNDTSQLEFVINSAKKEGIPTDELFRKAQELLEV